MKNRQLFDESVDALRYVFRVLGVSNVKQSDSDRVIGFLESQSRQLELPEDKIVHWDNTQLEMLKSKRLAETVVEKYNLIARPEFTGGLNSKKNIMSMIKHLITLRWLFSKKSSSTEGNSINQQSNPYSGIASLILGSLDVSPRRDTKLVGLSFTFHSIQQLF